MGEIGFFTKVDFELPGGAAANSLQPATIYGIIPGILREKGIHKVNEEGHEVYGFNEHRFTISTLQDYNDSPSWTLNQNDGELAFLVYLSKTDNKYKIIYGKNDVFQPAIESTQSNSGGRITLSRILERKVPYEMLECDFGRKYPALDSINIVHNIMKILEAMYGGNDGC